MHFNIFQNRMRSMHLIVKNRYFSKFQIPIAQTKASHDFQQRPISVATQKAANVFELLPQDILTYHIFQHLGDQDLISTGLTNKHFNQLSRDPHLKGLQMLFQAKLVNLEQEERLKFLKTPKAQDILKVIPTLCLSYTTLTDDDLNEILAILPESNNIRELNLMGNSIGNAGALAIATSQKLCQLSLLQN